jgi:hypothetical protein
MITRTEEHGLAGGEPNRRFLHLPRSGVSDFESLPSFEVGREACGQRGSTEFAQDSEGARFYLVDSIRTVDWEGIASRQAAGICDSGQ